MKKQNILSALFMMCLMLVGSVAFTGCGLEDDLNTDQFAPAVSLNVFGPSPVARGGQLRFIGTGLNQVTEVVFPGGSSVKEIKVVNEREIQVTVPQDAQPGNVTLVYAGGKIQTKTVLAYTEPVGFDEAAPFAPNPIKPGNILNIKGEYLNLVTSIIFAENVEVDKQAFGTHTRKEISLVVPFEAQSGKVALSFCATGDTIPNIIYSEAELNVVLPAVAEVLDIKGSKPGDVVTVKGTDFDLITKVIMPNDEEVDFKAIDEAWSGISFTLPASISTGYIRVAAASGVEVVVANNGVAEPTDLVATPTTGVREGDVITISGKNLDVVTSATFAGVDEAVALEEGATATSISVKAPAGFVTGVLSLNTGYDVSFPVASIETAKPEFESYNPSSVSAGGELTINGKNLDLVAKVTFTDNLAVTEFIAQSETALTLKVPATAVSGELSVAMGNGEVVTFVAAQISSPEFCFIPEMPNTSEIKAGEVVIATVVNGDKLTGVQIDGEDCQFILQGGETLYIGTPYNAGQKSKLKLISENGEIEYNLALIPNSEIVTVLWSGMAELGWSGNGQVYLGEDGGQQLIDAEAKAGDILRIKFQPTAADWQVQIWEGHWGGMYDEIKAENYDLEGNDYYYNITLTDELLATFTTKQWWGGLVLVQGQSCLVTSLELFQKVSMETVIWKGEAVADDWGNQPGFFSDGGAELLEAGMKVGSILRFYITPMEENWNLQIYDGHWNGQYNDLNQGNWNLAEHNGAVELEITQEIFDKATTVGGWGNAFLLNGDNVICTKVTIE